MNNLNKWAVIFSAALFAQTGLSATVVNGDFSSGLSGWTTQGDVKVTSGYAVLTSTGAYTGDFGGTNGAILSQALNVNAGQLVSFDFNFNAGDYLMFNDFSLFVGDQTRLISNIASVGSYGSSGWHTYSFIATTNFNSLMFIVSNALDTNMNSTLYIDNVKIGAVPIPAAIWLFGPCLFGVMGIGRKTNEVVLT